MTKLDGLNKQLVNLFIRQLINAMIDITDIKKNFGDLQVLKGISLHVDKGEIVSIVGPSGAGKTTLLQIIGTLDKPTSGNVIINGTETVKYPSFATCILDLCSSFISSCLNSQPWKM